MRQPPSPATLAVTVLLCLLAALAPLAHATPRAWEQSDFYQRSWAVAEGLPGNHVSAVAQDGQGFLWLATMAGLARFDGVEFVVFDERDGVLPSARFTALDASPSGRLWIGSDQGHLIRLEDGRFEVVAHGQYPEMRISSVAEAGDGSVWFTQSPRSSLDGRPMLQQWTAAGTVVRPDLEARIVAYPLQRAYDTRDQPGGPINIENHFPQLLVSRDARGAMWARAWAGSTLRLDDGLGDPFGPGDGTVLMFASPDLLARRTAERIELLESESGQILGSLEGRTDALRGVWLRDRRGLLWISSTQTLAAYAAHTDEPVARFHLGTRPLDVEEDQEGNIWVATRTRGLIRISPNPVMQIGPANGVALPAKVEPLTDGDARMVLQMLQPGDDRVHRDTTFRIGADGAPPHPDPGSFSLRDRRGTRWDFVARFPDGTRRDGSRTAIALNCFRLYEDPYRDDTLWVDGVDGLTRLGTALDRDPRIEAQWRMRLHTPPLFLPDGTVWVGTTEGLVQVRGDVLRRFDRQDGLPVNDVRALLPDGRGGLWIGTYGGGIVHHDGARFHGIDERHGLIESAVSSILPDGYGALWLGGNRGIQRVLLEDLEAVVEGRAQQVPAMLFGAEYGLDNAEATGAFSAAGVGRYLYFSTFGGLARIDPAVVAERERSPPRVHLLDPGNRGLLGTGSALTLPARRSDLSLPFTGLHFSAPGTLRFRHRLEGHDEDWIPSSPQRLISYPRLPAGAYRLRLQVRHSGAGWIEAPSAPRITVMPMWWQTPIAAALGALAVALLLLASWRLGNRQMRRRAEALQALVNERTADLQVERDQVARQAARLQELAEGRARFMSGISHELRTPLSLIIAPLADLGDGTHGTLPERVRAQLGGAHRNAQRLLRLVDRLLEVARVEAGVQSLRCTEVDLRAALAELVEQLLPLAEQRGSTLRAVLPDRPVPAWVDLLLMESVLLNLIVNALRHTPAGSQVVVELDPPGPEAEAAIHLRVRDDGPGIPADALPHLFERFFRARGEHAGGADGFGLGLPLVREVLERHGGRVDVESSGAGSCFHVRLRSGRAHLAEQDMASGPTAGRRQASLLSALAGSGDDGEHEGDPEEAVASAADETPEDDRKQVLVVDDNAEMRRLLRSYLESEFRIGEAEQGAAALERVRMSPPDLIISDLMMPVMDGHQLCQALRADPDSDFIPVLILTAKAGLEHRIEGLDRGADAYLAKPFDRRELLATVHALLRSQLRLREYYHDRARRVAAETDPAASPAPATIDADETGDPPAPSAKVEQLRARFNALVAQHLGDEDFRIEQLAEGMAQSRSSLHRWCREHLGQSPGDAIRNARLERAKQLLQRGEGSVTEVAYAVGFRSVAHFSTAFRQATGLPPSAFRRAPPSTSGTDAS